MALCIFLVAQSATSSQRGGRGGFGGGGFGGGDFGGGGFPGTPPDIGTALRPAAQTQDEFDTYRAIEVALDMDDRLALTENFLASYPLSQLRHLVLRARWEAFVLTGDDDVLIDAAREALEAENSFFESKSQSLPNRDAVPQFRTFEIAHFDAQTVYYQSLMEAYVRRMDWDAAVEFGELALEAEDAIWNSYSSAVDEDTDEYQTALVSHRAVQLGMLQAIMATRQNAGDVVGTIRYAESVLELDPEDLPTLITIGSVMAQQPAENEEELHTKMERAEEYARAAVENLDILLNSKGANQIGAEQETMLRFTVHSTLGLVLSRQQDYDSAKNEYRLALDAVPRDATTYYRLGLAYVSTDNAEDALSALARAVSVDPAFPAARRMLEQEYERVHGSLDDLDDFVDREGQQIANP